MRRIGRRSPACLTDLMMIVVEHRYPRCRNCADAVSCRLPFAVDGDSVACISFRPSRGFLTDAERRFLPDREWRSDK